MVVKIVQKHEIIGRIMLKYAGRAPITKREISVLYDEALARGYHSSFIYAGLKTVICKKYLREEYIPPNNNTADEPLDESRYIEDWEFRDSLTLREFTEAGGEYCLDGISAVIGLPVHKGRNGQASCMDG